MPRPHFHPICHRPRCAASDGTVVFSKKKMPPHHGHVDPGQHSPSICSMGHVPGDAARRSQTAPVSGCGCPASTHAYTHTHTHTHTHMYLHVSASITHVNVGAARYTSKELWPVGRNGNMKSQVRSQTLRQISG